MKMFYALKIAPILCAGLILSLCLANGEKPQEKQNVDCTKWVQKCLMDFQYIKPGMTRGEIEKKFPMDGGLQSVSPVRHTHPECRYFKIDVEFDFKRDKKDQGRAIMSPDDKAIKVSRPYIETPYID